MKTGSRMTLKMLLYFAGFLILAVFAAQLAALVKVPSWGQAGLVFAGTKILGDVIIAVFRRKRKYLYFEDYVREILLFMIVAALGILGVVAIENYLGGTVWIPLLAAALALIWR